jgi:hypothetical protein
LTELLQNLLLRLMVMQEVSSLNQRNKVLLFITPLMGFNSNVIKESKKACRILCWCTSWYLCYRKKETTYWLKQIQSLTIKEILTFDNVAVIADSLTQNLLLVNMIK